LDEVDKPGSEIEEYINEVDRILDEKISSILGIKSLINEFKGNLNEEKRLNDRINEFRTKNSFDVLNLDQEIDELEL
jgi:hypothetical protein